MDESLSLHEYRQLTGHLDLPTMAQMRHFAEFVSSAHNWYRFLPLLPPGVPFHFFVDPAAGLQLVSRGWDDSLYVIDREERSGHGSRIRTADYRRQFGFLAFSQRYANSISVDAGNGDSWLPPDEHYAVWDAGSQTLRPLPPEVLAAGEAFVSGVVHPLAARPQIFCHPDAERAGAAWPESSGGHEAWNRIVARSRLVEADPSLMERRQIDRTRADIPRIPLEVDLPLYRELEPERTRQHDGMVAAMVKVLRLVHPEFEPH